LKFPAIRGDGDRQRLGQAVEAYFRSGGLHLQCNIVSHETLLAAKRHPEEFPGLLVRVSGYSAYFNDLNDAMKDEIITRSAYDLASGRGVPFPEGEEEMLPCARVEGGGDHG
jgi:formate C-acetyltransferase